MQVSRVTAGMELSLEARLTKQNFTNYLQAQVTGTFVSAETGLQAPSLPLSPRQALPQSIIGCVITSCRATHS